ncbi:MAG: sugar phosphotransferase [Ignavibacteria bacterium]|nr:MAG: sugar phosphotransferase [Ignavibacteria bacterium]
MWALSNGYLHFVNVDKDFADIIYKSLERVTEELKKIINVEKEATILNGEDKITWLPQKSASDQASIILLSLLNYYKFSKDEAILEYINNLCNGILNMQKGDSTSFPYYAIMSWENLWHAYGNLQSYSLLKASAILEREDILLAAILEVNYFYKFLMNENYLSSFYIDKKNDEYIPRKTKLFSQIAYNFRVMVYACIEAYNITKDSSYAIMAGEIASWFLGNNIAEAQMYFPSSGICYDGINSQNEINKNSGAESTIEALLTLLAIEQNNISRKALNKYLAQDTY